MDTRRHGKYLVQSSEYSRSEIFPFSSVKRKTLLSLLQSETWQPYKITFLNIDFTEPGLETLFTELQKRANSNSTTTISYQNCIKPIAAEKYKKAESSSHNTNGQKEVAKKTSLKPSDHEIKWLKLLKTAKDFQGLNQTHHTLNILNELVSEITPHKDEKSQQLLSFVYRELAVIEHNYVATELRLVEQYLYLAWQAFLNSNKAIGDFSQLISLNYILGLSDHPIYQFIYLLDNKNCSQEDWGKKFDDLFLHAKTLGFPQDLVFIYQLATYLCNAEVAKVLQNESLQNFLTNEAFLAQLNALKVLYTFYQPFLEKPGFLSVSLMQEITSLRAQLDALRLDQKENSKTENTSQYGNSHVMYSSVVKTKVVVSSQQHKRIEFNKP